MCRPAVCAGRRPFKTCFNTSTWITHALYLPGENKLCLSAMDRSLSFYDVKRNTFTLVRAFAPCPATRSSSLGRGRHGRDRPPGGQRSFRRRSCFGAPGYSGLLRTLWGRAKGPPWRALGRRRS